MTEAAGALAAKVTTDAETRTLSVPVGSRTALIITATLQAMAVIGCVALAVSMVIATPSDRPVSPAVRLVWAAGSTGVSTVLALSLVQTVWRVLDARFELAISPDGCDLHPSLCRSHIAWSDIRASRVVARRIDRNGTRYVLELDLIRRVRSWAYPFGTHRLRIVPPHYSGVGLIRDAGRLVRAYRLQAGWKR